MKDLKFFLIGFIAGVITLFAPVIIWNTWALDYINTHGKLVPFCLAPVFAFVSSILIVGVADLHNRMFNPKGAKDYRINPFWGWFIVALAIEIWIVLASNT